MGNTVSVIFQEDQKADAKQFFEWNQEIAIESVCVAETDTDEELEQYVRETESDFIYFFDSNWIYSDKLICNDLCQEVNFDRNHNKIFSCI